MKHGVEKVRMAEKMNTYAWKVTRFASSGGKVFAQNCRADTRVNQIKSTN